MSNNKRNLFGQGLLVAACFGLPFGVGAGADEPRAARASHRAGPRVGGRTIPAVVGRTVDPGVIREEDAVYTVTQKLGVIRYPKRQVERAFDSVEEAYRYRLERAPRGRSGRASPAGGWCLSLHLDREARTLLEQVVEISPDHGPARAMLTKMNQSEATRARGMRRRSTTRSRRRAARASPRIGRVPSTRRCWRGAECGWGSPGCR